MVENRENASGNEEPRGDRKASDGTPSAAVDTADCSRATVALIGLANKPVIVRHDLRFVY